MVRRFCRTAKTTRSGARGVSQGHSDAIRRIPGVQDARQYTIPVESALESVRRGENPELTTREKHTRECFVVAKEGADKAAIEKAIVTMPNYFSDYDTTVHFISPGRA
jgi:diaminopimelate dehydrogenase